jgi:hypothetical protein
VRGVWQAVRGSRALSFAYHAPLEPTAGDLGLWTFAPWLPVHNPARVAPRFSRREKRAPKVEPAPKGDSLIGSTTDRAKSVATAASTALPPAVSTSMPAAEASGWFDATTAPDAITSRL